MEEDDDDQGDLTDIIEDTQDGGQQEETEWEDINSEDDSDEPSSPDHKRICVNNDSNVNNSSSNSASDIQVWSFQPRDNNGPRSNYNFRATRTRLDQLQPATILDYAEDVEDDSESDNEVCISILLMSGLTTCLLFIG